MDPAIDAKALPARPSLEQYKKQAKDRLRAGRADNPDYILADAQFAIAREHGFENWSLFSTHLRGLRQGPVRDFECAIDAIIAGDVESLETLLRENPGLAHARSSRVHHATLLHYVAANGVEGFRQRTPVNAAAVANALFRAGARADATADIYGGASTTMDMLVSSAHPARAGVQVALVDTLLDGGAAIDGPTDNGSPLMTALAFHYPDAAEALLRRGARVDNILAAAGLGREDLVKGFIGGDLRPAVRWPRIPNDFDARRALALVWAAGFGHTRIVDLLLEHGVDPRVRDHQGFTPLHSAAFYGHLDTVDLLLERHAPLDAENVYGGDVLASTIWAFTHSGLPVDYAPIIARLTRATESTARTRLGP